MKHIHLIILFAIIISVSGCNVTETAEKTLDMPDFNIDDGKKGNEVVFDDSKFEKSGEQVVINGENVKDRVFTDKDGSTVRISYDGYGNKTETRQFFNHPNLKMLVVTESKDGVKEGLVYGHNNEKKKLPAELIDNAVSASGNEIANRVGINATRRETTSPVLVQNTQPVQNLPRMPDPRVQPINNQTQETVESEAAPVQTQPNVETEKPNVTVAQDKRKKENDN